MEKKNKSRKNAQRKLSFKPLKPLGKVKFHKEQWNIDDTVRLTNGKQYKVVNLDIQHSRLDLRSDEYDSIFRADCRIIHEKIKVN